MYSKLFLLLLFPGLIFAQKPNTAVPTTPAIPPQQIQKSLALPPDAASNEIKTIENPKTRETLPELKETISSVDGVFPHPGIYFEKNSKWLGDDNLFNLNKDIQIVVEVQKTKNVSVNIDSNYIKSLINHILKKTTLVPKKAEQPPFPYYHMLIMIAQIEKGFAVYCSGRLFESVTLDRTNLAKNVYFQAITWEKQALLVVPSDKVKDEIEQAVSEITNNFVERYRHFEDIKLEKTSP